MVVDRGAERRSEILGLLRFGAIHGQWEGRLIPTRNFPQGKIKHAL